MREIKFRAWAEKTTDNRWNYAYPLCEAEREKSGDPDFDEYLCREKYATQWNEKYGEENRYTKEKMMITDIMVNGKVQRPYGYEVLDVMQYIGLKDKNGKDIYQGDILKLNNDNYDPEYEGFYVGLAEVTSQTCGFSLKPIPKLEEPNIYDSSMFWHVGEEDTTEVVGNIYENPELLEIK